MDPWEMLEAQVDVVATLGELVAAVTTPRGDVWPFVSPEYLHAALRTFTCTLQDTLSLHEVTSLGYLAVTSLGHALSALGATSGATWADVRATVRAWRESVDALRESWHRVVGEALDLPGALKGKATYSLTDMVMDLCDSIASRRTAGDNLVDTTQQPPVACPTRTGQWAGEVRNLLGRLTSACSKAESLTFELPDRIWRIELIAWMREETSLDVLEDLVASLAKAKRLSKASARLATDHLLRAVGDIHDLLLRPYGGSGGPLSSGGPGARLVARLCQKAIEDIPRLRREAAEDTPGPRQEQRRAPSWGETSNGSSTTGTPEQPEGTWGKPEPGAVCDTASRLPKHPDLLPPGTRCELATSKSVRFVKDCYHEWIPVRVPGTSPQRQDFLIIGKGSTETVGLSVLPAVVSANCNEELKVLALAHKAPVVIEPKTPIAVAIALPMNRNERAGYRELPCDGFNPAPNDRWVKQITKEQPELECSLTHMESGETVQITGMLDTGADVTAISHGHWPSDWNLGPPECLLTGFGGATECKQSKSEITVTGPEGKTADIRPYVVWDNSTVWGRDVMFQWRAKMELDS
ncbi:uncharacterized protein [Chamaea fasciata]|uniref:uncharacterized protein n=1 Tax=Chamaea fasciata TaxID=190680 RepID=UPI00336A103F